MSVIALWIVTLTLFLLGLLGVFIPAIPGLALIFAGILFYAVMTNFATISLNAILFFGLVVLLSWVAGFSGSLIGSRLGGGKRWAISGAMIGGLVGTLLGPFGLMIGAFIGALAGALYEGQSGPAASRVAFWTIIGLIGATFMQFVVGLSLIIAFLLVVFF